MAPSTPTTVVFVPGAWHNPQCYSIVAHELRKAGYSTLYVNLPSVGPSKHLPNWSEDVAAIQAQIKKAIDRKHRVIVCVHSYGGAPTSEAIKNLPSGSVSHVFYCCSFLIPDGESLSSAFGGGDLPWYDVSEDKLEVKPMTPEKVFYNDMAEDEVASAINALKPFSYQCLQSEVTWAAWKHIPSTYLYCTKDQAIPIEAQKMMVEEWAKGYNIRTESVDASHSPFYSQPVAVANAIRRAAGEVL